METSRFRQLVHMLTGTPAKEVSETDEEFLAIALEDESRQLDCSQFNELLLLVNKDRVEAPFFCHFFGEPCAVSELHAGVERFQKAAMLLYGNFIYAYRTLSALSTDRQLHEALGRFAIDADQLVSALRNRSSKVLETEVIPREDTHLVGYLSPAVIIAENKRSRLLKQCFESGQLSAASTWDDIEGVVQSVSNPSEHAALLAIIRNYRRAHHSTTAADFENHVGKISALIQEKYARIDNIRRVATRNQDVYLTWDHMDVYFATSMREQWEYESLFDFVQNLMSEDSLAELNLRYFDPTQSYTINRINKGLVEALMLKRAKCTVYSVQDTDTLGKDSELAATLAQGKPVIAYVPEIDPVERSDELFNQAPSAILQRLRFVAHSVALSNDELQFARSFQALEEYAESRIWRCLDDAAAFQGFRDQHRQDLERLCRIIATAEKRNYDKRAHTLAEVHPLGVQVHLETGVANGVLVVRSIGDCAALLRRVLTNSLQFGVELNDDDQMWYLRERISGCIYRVVSSDRKLTNCFWNFYRRQDQS